MAPYRRCGLSLARCARLWRGGGQGLGARGHPVGAGIHLVGHLGDIPHYVRQVGLDGLQALRQDAEIPNVIGFIPSHIHGARSAAAAQNTNSLVNRSIEDVKTGTDSTNLAVSAMQDSFIYIESDPVLTQYGTG